MQETEQQLVGLQQVHVSIKDDATMTNLHCRNISHIILQNALKLSEEKQNLRI